MNDWRATAEKLGGISRAKVFDLWASGKLESKLIGTRRFSTDEQIAKFIDALPSVVDKRSA
ncbi:hypothetical protein A5784_34900 [Mycobacterium sp. 852013-50091_SCH5140682]|uniref:hypothetical protein n=1 Tax=Mycobacterium sp. 852013-50091_SCH5140682 TaxID=1834109 RepID=UPI0007EC1036|nr:hypothetical protein [Mycobacterium sp. 852013-50091_SCH5140682]OBC11464.1 hypothetical protein A5784_34900 [Mycobacterium sp. 852013-50091_SCH5140682]